MSILLRRLLATVALTILFTSGFAQVIANEFRFDSLLHLESARRFPYIGKLDLAQNYPNPFSTAQETTIRYKAIDAVDAQLIVYSEKEKEVQSKQPINGVGKIILRGADLSPGVYVYVLIINGRRISKKTLVVSPE
jgi:hypothetical protein